MDGEVNTKTEQISGMILDYLLRNPEAGDTLEGIAEWWLEIERIESSVDDVADALESLVQRGMIKTRESKGRTIFCGINQEN
jgi:Fe2+ or Zn2+ uptake regulation protein